MLIGVPKEIKPQEYRVALTPAGAAELHRDGHRVLLQTGAGLGAGFADDAYRAAGAELCDDAAELFARAELVLKVKEPLTQECSYLKPRQLLFTFLHLAAEPQLAKALCQSRARCIAYETVSDGPGLPLLAPMSEVAGRLAVQAAAHALEKHQGGRGLLLAGVPGVMPARVLVLGGGTVGINAARLALGLGADVTVVDRALPRLRYLDEAFGPRLHTLAANQAAIEELLPQTDVIIGAVLVPGAQAPRLLQTDHLAALPEGAVLVDVAIDQGGCFASSRPTTHAQPTFIEQGVVHYCVANMPGAVPRTSTLALTNATLPYIRRLASGGTDAALNDAGLRAGINVWDGQIVSAPVAAALDLPLGALPQAPH